MSTRNKILNLLNREPATVNELSEKLGISRNSTHLQVVKLESEGHIQSHRRMSSTAGKPALEFTLSPGAEDAYSTAHKPVLDALLSVISDELPAKQRINLLREVGKKMARDAELSPSGDTDKDLQRAVDVVNQLGAMAEQSVQNRQPCITSYSCPIGSQVHKSPDSCELVAAFFSAATGKPVTSHCRRAETVVCQFLVDARSSAIKRSK